MFVPPAPQVDNIGEYLLLFSLGATAAFAIDGRVVDLRSGDCLIFNGSESHGVVHGLRAIRPGTCPPSLDGRLHSARVSLLVRQQADA